MPMSTRAALAAALSLAGVACLVARSAGQQDGEVRKANSPATPKAVAPATIGTLDLDTVLNGYEKFKAVTEKFKADVMKEQEKLAQLMGEGKQAQEEMARFKPDSAEFKKYNDRVADIRAKLEANREKLQGEFAMRQAEFHAQIYNEIQRMATAVAKKRGMNYVFRINSEPVSGLDPQMVMAGMARGVLYSEPSADITNEVILYLNHNYKLASGGGATPKAAAAGAGAATKKK